MLFLRKYLFILLVYTCSCINAQNPAQEIININRAFYKEYNIAVETVIKYFIDNSVKPAKEIKQTIYKIPGCSLNKSGYIESMTNEKYKVNINHQKKNIIIESVMKQPSKNGKINKNLFDDPNLKMSLDTVLDYYKKVSLKNIDSEKNEITFWFKSGLYDFITITYNKASYEVYSYYIKLSTSASQKSNDGRQHQYHYIITNSYLNKKSLSRKLFDEKEYVNISKTGVYPSDKYKGYEIINYIKNK